MTNTEQQPPLTEAAARLATARLLLESLDCREAAMRLAEEEPCLPADTTASWLKRVAKRYRLRITSYHVREDGELENVLVPAIAVMSDGRHFIVGQHNATHVLVFDPAAGKPQAWPRTEFMAAAAGAFYYLQRPWSWRDFGERYQLQWFVPALLRYKKFLLEVVMASFFLQLLGIVTPVFTQVIIDKVLLHHGTVTLNVLAGGLLLAAVVQALMSILRTYLSNHTTNKLDMILGVRLLRHLLSLPLRYFELRRVGDTLTRVAALNSIREFLTGSAVTACLDAVFSILFIALMCYYSVTLTVVALLVVPLYLALNILATPLYRERLQSMWSAGAENNAFLVEAVNGIHTMKALALEPQFNHRWEHTLSRYIAAAFQTTQFQIWLNGAGSTIQNMGGFLILLLGGHQVMEGRLTLGQLIAFQMLSGQVSAPLLRLTGLWQTWQQTSLAMERLADILKTPPEPGLQAGTIPAKPLAGEIVFSAVDFRYQVGGPLILQDISFMLQPGMQVGIVGRSGSGKSTLTKLLQRLYVAEAGRVTIDGVDVNEINPAWLRQQIGVVLQENFLFNGSVRDNIAYARPNAGIEEVIRAAQLAGAHDFILELPEGYDTKVGERGTALSGGQQQRLAIARALLNEPRILIFDEATSALDYESERIIMGNMQQMAAQRTVLLIAHRLSTVRHCNLILVLDKGKLVESGSHQELLARQGLYAALYQQQEV